MAVKEMLKYKQRGDRTEHWVREGSKTSSAPSGGGWATMTVSPIQWAQGLGTAVGTATQAQIPLQQQQMYQQYSTGFSMNNPLV